MAVYSDPDNSEVEELQFVTSDDLKRTTKARQIKIMKLWFLDNYDRGNPLDISPVVNVREELLNEFHDIPKAGVIDNVVSILDRLSPYWVRRPETSMEDFYSIDAALELDENRPLDAVRIRLGKLKRLLDLKDRIERDLHEFQRMMIFSFCIMTMESYLSDVFLRRMMSSQEYKERFLATDKVLSEKKFGLSEIYKRHADIDAEIKMRLASIVFHNLGPVSGLFTKVFGMPQFPGIRPLIAAVAKRHDFVHRGGKDKDGNKVETTVEEIRAIIDQIDSLCAYIDAYFAFSVVVVTPPRAEPAV